MPVLARPIRTGNTNADTDDGEGLAYYNYEIEGGRVERCAGTETGAKEYCLLLPVLTQQGGQLACYAKG
jgi:hypothetical protein